ncbi:MAG: polyphenol oxidase family protein [Myxococcota bacterium]
MAIYRKLEGQDGGVKLDREQVSSQFLLVIIHAANFADRVDVVHGFTTRTDQAGERLHLGTGSSKDDWERAARSMGVPEMGVSFVSQVHGNDVLRASGAGLVGEADALITDVKGLLIAVRTADCVPILVVGQGVVAAIHAGWRGLAAGVIPKTIRKLSGAGPFVAAVGPAIGVACYEVGEEVVTGIARWVPEEQFVLRDRKRPHVDLAAAAAYQLREAGIDNVEVTGICTFSDARLWSHRGEAVHAGRQAGLVGLRC